eukprot:scaffold287209_cov27-Prasinocladus_malaysianus.AAC.1
MGQRFCDINVILPVAISAFEVKTDSNTQPERFLSNASCHNASGVDMSQKRQMSLALTDITLAGVMQVLAGVSIGGIVSPHS